MNYLDIHILQIASTPFLKCPEHICATFYTHQLAKFLRQLRNHKETYTIHHANRQYILKNIKYIFIPIILEKLWPSASINRTICRQKFCHQKFCPNNQQQTTIITKKNNSDNNTQTITHTQTLPR